MAGFEPTTSRLKVGYASIASHQRDAQPEFHRGRRSRKAPSVHCVVRLTQGAHIAVPSEPLLRAGLEKGGQSGGKNKKRTAPLGWDCFRKLRTIPEKRIQKKERWRSRGVPLHYQFIIDPGVLQHAAVTGLYCIVLYRAVFALIAPYLVFSPSPEYTAHRENTSPHRAHISGCHPG